MNLFPVWSHDISGKRLSIKSERIAKIVRSFNPDGQLLDESTDDLYTVLNDVERMQFDVRAALEEKETLQRTSRSDEIGELSMKDFPVTVSFDGEVLTVTTPLVLNRKPRHVDRKDIKPPDFYLATYVTIALKKWAIDHPDIDLRWEECFHRKEKNILIITRKDARYSLKKHQDNDNFEERRVLNAICSALVISDCCNSLTIINRFEAAEDPSKSCTEFKIGPATRMIQDLSGMNHDIYFEENEPPQKTKSPLF